MGNGWYALAWALAWGVALSGAAQAAPRGATVYSYYEIHGRTAGELYDAMLRRGPALPAGRAAALTLPLPDGLAQEWAGGSCKLQGRRVSIDFVIYLPRLADRTALRPETRARWAQFAAFARRHEETHRAIWLSCAAQLEERLAALPADACAAADALAEAAWLACKQRNDAFDAADRGRLRSHPFLKLAQRRALRSAPARGEPGT